MSDNALEKWHPGKVSRDATKIEKAIEKILSLGRLDKDIASTYLLRPWVLGSRGYQVVDLPRVCALHDKPYVARYIADEAGIRFRHTQTIRVTQQLYESQYEEGGVCFIPACDLGEESCAWCGGHGVGSVLCGKCRKEVCYGKTVERHFRCRPSCGGEGKIVTDIRPVGGLIPSLGSDGPRSSS